MRRTSKSSAIAGVVTLGIGLLGVVVAQDNPNVTRSARGGGLVTTPRHQFEVFFYRTGLRVFPRGISGASVRVVDLSGTATFTLPGAPKPFVYPLKGGPATAGREPESLDLVVDLSRVPAQGSTVAFEIAGLADPAEGRVSFTVPFALVPTVAEPRPSPEQAVAPAAPSPRYTYGPGYYGYGYYESTRPGPQSRSAGPHNYRTTPGMFGPGGMTVGPYHRDWTTGRSLPLSKPWLRPMD